MLSIEEYAYRIWKSLGAYDPDTGEGVQLLTLTHKADLLAKIINPAMAVWTPPTGKTVRLMGGCISVSVAGYVVFTDNAAAGTVIWRTPVLVANTPYNFDMGNGYPLSGANRLLFAFGSNTATAITGTLYGREE
jgi:hypothetical protein